MVNEIKQVVIKTREEWRNWLAKHHLTESKVALVSYKKHTGHSSISHKEAMHEAICFGWIDTTIKKLDEEKYLRYFVRRGDKANWSKNTLSYGKELFEAGKMADFGIKRYQEGLKKKPFDFDIPDNPDVPKDLENELKKNKSIKEKFEKIAPSQRRMLLRWLFRAKGSETRNKRIKSIIEQVKGNKKVF